MAPAPPQAAVFTFSTDHWAPHERADAVQAMHERCTLPFQPEPMEALPDYPVRVHIKQWAPPGLGMMSGALSGLRQHIRPRRDAPTGSDDVFFALSIDGSSIVRGRSNEVVVREGEAFLATRGTTGFTVLRPTCVRFIGLRFPVRTLSALIPQFDRSEIRVIPRASPTLKLLGKYLSLIARESTLAAVELQQLAVSHIYDLTAVTLGATSDQAVLARNSLRAARLAAIKADIITHIADGNLNASAVAARQDVTLRYLQKLFETLGTTFSKFVLDQRLANAFRMLRNPLHAHRSISAIAYESGFNDLSYFNRTFRRRYASTPSQARHGCAHSAAAGT
jgi:AraC-like DNA-binding protein